MNVSGVGSTMQATSASFSTPTSRASDGDYKASNANTSSVKDSDGDFKPSTAASRSSAGTQAALNNIKVGG